MTMVVVSAKMAWLVSASFPVAVGKTTQLFVFLYPFSHNGEMKADRGGGQADSLSGCQSAFYFLGGFMPAGSENPSDTLTLSDTG